MNRSLQKFIARHAEPILNSAGFSGEDAAFFRDRKSYLDIVEVQESNTDSSQVRFTLNLGISVPAIERVVWGNECQLRTASCFLRRRVGDLVEARAGKQFDIWWTLNDAQVGIEVERVLLEVIIPYLDRFDSLDSLQKEMGNTPSWLLRQALHRIYMALLEAKVGNKSLAAKALKELRDDKMMSAWIPKIFKVAEEASIDLRISAKATK